MTEPQIQSKSDYEKYRKWAAEDPNSFWANEAAHFLWKKPWEKVSEWDFIQAKISWFQGAKLNITENLLDRHLEKNGDKIAVYWEPNDPADACRQFTYRQLYREVCKMSNALKSIGVQKGDRICIYLPMIPELMIAALAAARIGAVHSIVFAGFSAQSLADRIEDASARWLISCDGMDRGTKRIDIKPIVDEALQKVNCIEKQIILNYKNSNFNLVQERDIDWQELIVKQSDEREAEPMDSEDPLFILYTSGSTGKPKGVVHSIAGYMVYTAFSFREVFQYQPSDIFFCTADMGWITGHSYMLYGPLLQAATEVMFEGIPSYPDASRFWKIVDKYQVTHFYTAPTAIRSLMALGKEPLQDTKRDSLRLLGTVGEPINEEAWHWYHQEVGKGKCPIVDTWWQTETGGILISGLGDHLEQKPGYAGLPLPGIQLVLLDEKGNLIMEPEKEGYLCVAEAWPSMIRTTFGDHERCRLNYFDAFPSYYFTGDAAKRDAEGRYRIIGRVDDVINVSGHRLGTAEIENAINSGANVVESAVVGYPHPIKGQGIYAYVILEMDKNEPGALEDQKNEIQKSIARMIGKIALCDEIQFVKALPKTRSGKIMRRILRKIAEKDCEQLGDISTLLDPSVVDEIKKQRLNSF